MKNCKTREEFIDWLRKNNNNKEYSDRECSLLGEFYIKNCSYRKGIEMCAKHHVGYTYINKGFYFILNEGNMARFKYCLSLYKELYKEFRNSMLFKVSKTKKNRDQFECLVRIKMQEGLLTWKEHLIICNLY